MSFLNKLKALKSKITGSAGSPKNTKDMPLFKNLTVKQTEAFLKSEIPAVMRNLNETVRAFYANHSQEAAKSVCIELTNAYIYNCPIYAAKAMHEGVDCYHLKGITDFGYVMQLFTEETEIDESVREEAVPVPFRELLYQLLHDPNPKGMAINRFQWEKVGALLIINEKNAQNILRIAEEQIASMPKHVQKAIRSL